MNIMLSGWIDFLEKRSASQVVLPIGLWRPHSYRGDYYELGLEPVYNIPVADALHVARWAVGKWFQGYKGDWFLMKENTDVHIAQHGYGEGYALNKLTLSGFLHAWSWPALDLNDSIASLFREPVPQFSPDAFNEWGYGAALESQLEVIDAHGCRYRELRTGEKLDRWKGNADTTIK